MEQESQATSDIELPDFEKLFNQIQRVSPLARSVILANKNYDDDDNNDNNKINVSPSALATSRTEIEEQNNERPRGFAAVDDKYPSDVNWTILEGKRSSSGINRSISNKRSSSISHYNTNVHQVAKIDNYAGDPAPLLRFRTQMKGRCISNYFVDFLMDYEQRKRWDHQVDEVYEIYPIFHLDEQEVKQRKQHKQKDQGDCHEYGICSRLGVGYCKSKTFLGIASREQLTFCGVQDFNDGSCIIWGTELDDADERNNRLLPPGPRVIRAKSKIFCTTLTPTGNDTFDIEYVLQFSIGGDIPPCITTPIVSLNVKNLFRYAKKVYSKTISPAPGSRHGKAEKKFLRRRANNNNKFPRATESA